MSDLELQQRRLELIKMAGELAAPRPHIGNPLDAYHHLHGLHPVYKLPQFPYYYNSPAADQLKSCGPSGILGSSGVNPSLFTIDSILAPRPVAPHRGHGAPFLPYFNLPAAQHDLMGMYVHTAIEQRSF